MEGWEKVGSRCGGRLVGGCSRRQERWAQICEGKKKPVMRTGGLGASRPREEKLLPGAAGTGSTCSDYAWFSMAELSPGL